MPGAGKTISRSLKQSQIKFYFMSAMLRKLNTKGAVRERLPGFYVPPYKFGLPGTTLLHGSWIRVLEAPHYVYGCLN